MSYPANIPGFEGQVVEVQTSFWSGPKLLVNGIRIPKGARGEMILTRGDGTQVAAAWKHQLFGIDVPQVVVDGKTIELVEPLKWYQWLWGGWPVFLVAIGGLTGAVAGVAAFSINAGIFRSKMATALKFLLTGVVSVAAVVAVFAASLLVSMLLRK